MDYPTGVTRPVSRRERGFPDGSRRSYVPSHGVQRELRRLPRRDMRPLGPSPWSKATDLIDDALGKQNARRVIFRNAARALGRLNVWVALALLSVELAQLWLQQGRKGVWTLPNGWKEDPTCAASANCGAGPLQTMGLCPANCGAVLTDPPAYAGGQTMSRLTPGVPDFLGRPTAIFGKQYIYTPAGAVPAPSVDWPQRLPNPLRRPLPELPPWLPRAVPELLPPQSPEPPPVPPPVGVRRQDPPAEARRPIRATIPAFPPFIPGLPNGPGPRNKENKFNRKSALGRALLGISLFTEFLDWSRAAFHALPADIVSRAYAESGGFPSAQDKLEFVYRYWHLVDGPTFLENIYQQELMDRFVGGTAAAASKRFPGYGTPVRGPSARLREEWDNLRRSHAFEYEDEDEE